jgi:hypothetical protein
MPYPGRVARWTATAVGIVYAVVLYVTGTKIQNGWRHALTYLPTVAALLVVIFDKWVWRWPLICRLHNRPYIAGLWKVGLTPDEVSHIPPGGNWHPVGYVVIEQTFWGLSITQFTPESTSYSRSVTWQKQESSNKQALSFIYSNRPKREHIDRSRPHLGGCLLDVANGKPATISGEYFTERFTAGSMELTLMNRSTNYVSHAQAAAAEATNG